MHLHTKLATLALAALMLAGLAGPAAAARPPQINPRGDGVGSYELDDAGTAHLSGAVIGKPFDGPYIATLAADDGTLPDPGDCEPAAATLSVTGPRGKYRGRRHGTGRRAIACVSSGLGLNRIDAAVLHRR